MCLATGAKQPILSPVKTDWHFIINFRLNIILASVSDISKTYRILHELLEDCTPILQSRKETASSVEYAGTKTVMQGKQKVDGHYFAAIVSKPKDVRLYFLPIYTHPKEYAELSEEVRKFLKGKSCFHLKNLHEAAIKEIKTMIARGIDLYQKDGLI